MRCHFPGFVKYGPNRGPIASQLIGVNDLWDIVFTQDPAQERLRGFGIAVTLEQDVEHEAVLDILLSSGQAPRGAVVAKTESVADAIDARTYLVQVPAGTPAQFPLAQFLSKEGAEFDTPLAEGLVADLNAALVQQFLNIPATQGEAMVEPNGVLDDTHWETVAVGLGIGHGRSIFPSLINATQPFEEVFEPLSATSS